MVSPPRSMRVARELGIELGEEKVDESRSRLRLRQEAVSGRREILRGRYRLLDWIKVPSVDIILMVSLSAFECGLRRVVWVETRRVADAREDGGFGCGELRGGFAEVELCGGFGAEGVASEVRGVEVPLEDLGAPELGGDLRGKDAFTQGALEGGRFVEEQ